MIPLVGLCIGVPYGDKSELKPRLPQSMVLFENQYQPLDKEQLAVYDETMLKYYEGRPVKAPFTVKKVKGWSEHIQDHLQRSILPEMLDYLNKQGYANK
ncbi:Oxygen-insensitive NADPH nitroreductase [compost metagenome]